MCTTGWHPGLLSQLQPDLLGELNPNHPPAWGAPLVPCTVKLK